MGGGDLAVLAIWTICLGVSLAVSILIGWRRPGRAEDEAEPGVSPTGIVDAASAAPIKDAAAGPEAEPAAGIAANAPGAPAEERRPPAA